MPALISLLAKLLLQSTVHIIQPTFTDSHFRFDHMTCVIQRRPSMHCWVPVQSWAKRLWATWTVTLALWCSLWTTGSWLPRALMAENEILHHLLMLMYGLEDKYSDIFWFWIKEKTWVYVYWSAVHEASWNRASLVCRTVQQLKEYTLNLFR